MQESEWTRILEPALRAHIASRCHRAYRHDLKNGLQGIYGSFDALNRLLQMPLRDVAKIERTNEFVRQAIAGHEKSLERVLQGLAPLEQTADRLDAAALLYELVRFLINDAAAQRVTVRCAEVSEIPVHARHDRLRLALLSLMVDAIDAMPGGGLLQVSATSADPLCVIELIDTRPAAPLENPWSIDLAAVPAYRGWMLFVVRQLIHGEAGTIECDTSTQGRKLRISLPLA